MRITFDCRCRRQSWSQAVAWVTAPDDVASPRKRNQFSAGPRYFLKKSRDYESHRRLRRPNSIKGGWGNNHNHHAFSCRYHTYSFSKCNKLDSRINKHRCCIATKQVFVLGFVDFVAFLFYRTLLLPIFKTAKKSPNEHVY